MTPHLLIRRSLDYGAIELVPMTWDQDEWVVTRRPGVAQGIVLIEGTVTVPTGQRVPGPANLRHFDAFTWRPR